LIEHILVNLVLNARDAMPNGGSIIISTAILHLDEAQVLGSDDARVGEFVRLAVRDTGCGLEPELRSRLFEPFGSSGSKGMGLGLAGVYGAVRQLSGWIEYTTEVGAGTEMRVFLPAAPAAEVLAQIQAKPAAPVVKGTILLIEPEEKVRRLARCILNWNDYKVIEAEDSATALLLWDGQASNIDLLLTDINLSGDISGRELANRFQEVKPGLKVIYTCNASLEKDKQLPPTLQHQGFISKPYTPDKLMLAVESHIGRG
jgi:CheY-like chemotaxis protein